MANKYRIRIVHYEKKPSDYILEKLVSAKYETYEAVETFKSEEAAKAYYEEIKIVAFYHHIGPMDNYPKLMLVDSKGKITDSLGFPLTPKVQQNLFLTGPVENPAINIYDETGVIQQYNSELTRINEIKFEQELHVGILHQIDLNNDQNKENIFLSTKPRGKDGRGSRVDSRIAPPG